MRLGSWVRICRQDGFAAPSQKSGVKLSIQLRGVGIPSPMRECPSPVAISGVWGLELGVKIGTGASDCYVHVDNAYLAIDNSGV